MASRSRFFKARYFSANFFGTEVVVVQPPATGYVNDTITYTPRHQRLGGAVRPPRPRPAPQPLFATISTGQGNQSVSAKAGLFVQAEFITDSAAQSSEAVAEFAFAADVSVRQMQFANSEARAKITASVRSSQLPSSVSGVSHSEMIAIVKTGGEALMIPSYSGDEIPDAGEEPPDAFFESADRAA